MKAAEKKREKLLNSNPKVNLNRRETKESKKIRDANTTTLMLIVVISVSQNIHNSPNRNGSFGETTLQIFAIQCLANHFFEVI